MSVQSAFDKAVAFLGGLDGLVNCAGSQSQGPAEDLDARSLLHELSVHVLGTAFTNAAAFPHLKNSGGGSIVNYSSYAGVCGMAGMAAYSAAKGGVLAYSRTIAKEWGQHGIRVNVICPAIMTDVAQAWYDNLDAATLAHMQAWTASAIPLGGQLGKPSTAADLNAFLVSDRASFIHGQTIGVDGGMVMSR